MIEKLLAAAALINATAEREYLRRSNEKESDRRRRKIGTMIRKGRKSIAAKQAFLYASSKQPRILARNRK
jgi:hypothetical protein